MTPWILDKTMEFCTLSWKPLLHCLMTMTAQSLLSADLDPKSPLEIPSKVAGISPRAPAADRMRWCSGAASAVDEVMEEPVRSLFLSLS
jgi:hypothetical protein